MDDLPGTRDRAERPRTVAFLGSIKWRERSPFTDSDRNALAAQLERIPGTGPATRLVAVTRAGIRAGDVDASFGPEELVSAFGAP